MSPPFSSSTFWPSSFLRSCVDRRDQPRCAADAFALAFFLGRAGQFELVVQFDAAVPVVDVQDVQRVVGKGCAGRQAKRRGRQGGDRGELSSFDHSPRLMCSRRLPLFDDGCLEPVSPGMFSPRQFPDASGIRCRKARLRGVVALVGNHLAVIGKADAATSCDRSAKLGDRRAARLRSAARSGAAPSTGSTMQPHDVAFAVARHDEPRPARFPDGGAAISAICLGSTNMPFTLVRWSARPIQPLIRVLVRPQGETARQNRRQVASAEPDHRIGGVEARSPPLRRPRPSGTGSPVPGRTISTMRFSLTIMPGCGGRPHPRSHRR